MGNRVNIDSLATVHELRHIYIRGDSEVVSTPLSWRQYEGQAPDGVGLYKRLPDGTLEHVQDFWDNGKERHGL